MGVHSGKKLGTTVPEGGRDGLMAEVLWYDGDINDRIKLKIGQKSLFVSPSVIHLNSVFSCYSRSRAWKT